MAPPLPADDSAQLIPLVLRSDESAARALVNHLAPTIAKIVNSYPTLRDETDDLMQDVFFKIFRALPKFRGDAPLEHWASRITRCACLDRLRRKKARPEQRFSDLTPDQAALLENLSGEEPSAAKADLAFDLLEKLLATLRPIDAWLLRQVELAERSIAEVAAEAGWNVSLAHVRLFRARARLRRAYEKLEPPSV